MEFEVGDIYNRQRDVHGQYGGQPQGGMATPKGYPVIFLFTGEGGAEHGYRDEFKPDGTYHYTGEGQRGDMSFVRSNRALPPEVAGRTTPPGTGGSQQERSCRRTATECAGAFGCCSLVRSQTCRW